MSKYLLIGNWKCQGNTQEIHQFLTFVGRLSIPKSILPVLCPPFPYLDLIKKRLPAGYALGAQTCSAHTEGAFTGEVSASMLQDVGCGYVIIGHAERNEHLDVLEKHMEHALQAGLTPIFCLGEEDPSTLHTLAKKISYLSVLSRSFSFYVAYEPVWAIGGKTPPSDAYLAQAQKHLRSHLRSIKGLIYGGGVRPENLSALLNLNIFDGIMVGKASFQQPVWAMMLAILETYGERLHETLVCS